MAALQFVGSKAVLHLAELATLVSVLRPVYAIGYIATMQTESGLDFAYPVPKFPPVGGEATFQEQLGVCAAEVQLRSSAVC